MNKTRRQTPAGVVQTALNEVESNCERTVSGASTVQSPGNFIHGGSRPKNAHDDFYKSKGFWNDLKTLRWIQVPSSSFKLLLIPLILYFVCAALGVQNNPFEPMLFISHYLPESEPHDPRYGKGWLDLTFIAYHIIVFSFVRQFTLFEIIFPVARRLGIKKRGKLDRFGEQAYAMLYYGAMGFWGIYIMSKLPTWWYKTEHFWLDYPHWRMQPVLKRYYLMHFSYWLQQLIILALKLEKPRKDFNVLIAHHLVTVWLIGWSYGTDLTRIGNAVFVSMDIPDAFFALAKLCNYLGLSRTKVVAFIFFVFIWTYFRHWLNLAILYSVWTEFTLIPEELRYFQPRDGLWMAWWMKYQIFMPLFLLKLLNLFWYFLILRILVRALSGGDATDDRSDDEDEPEDNGDDKED